MIGYYITVIDDDDHVYRMCGPFDTHEEALESIIRASRETDAIDPRTVWWRWGTCKLTAETLPLGRLDRLPA